MSNKITISKVVELPTTLTPNTLYFKDNGPDSYDVHLTTSDPTPVLRSFKRFEQAANTNTGVGELTAYHNGEILTERRFFGKPVYRNTFIVEGSPHLEVGILEIGDVPDIDHPIGNWIRKDDLIGSTDIWYDGAGMREQDISGGGALINSGIFFKRTVPYPVKMYGHTITKLADGRILCIGGHPLSTPATNLCYIGEADINGVITYTSTTNFTTDIAYHTATLLPDGRVLVIGGYNGTAATNKYYFVTVEVGNTLTIVESASVYTPGAIYYHNALILPDERILVLGGYISGSASNTTSFLTVSGNTITRAAGNNLPEKLYGQSSILLSDNRVFMTGGHPATVAATVNTRLLTITGNTIVYVKPANLPTMLVHHTMAIVLDNRIMIIGGYSGTASTSTTYIATIVNNTVTYGASAELQDPVHMHSSIVLDTDHLLVTGGSSNGTISANAMLSNDLGNVLLNHALYYIVNNKVYCVNTGLTDTVTKLVYTLEYTKLSDTETSPVAQLPGCYNVEVDVPTSTGRKMLNKEVMFMLVECGALPDTTTKSVAIPYYTITNDYWFSCIAYSYKSTDHTSKLMLPVSKFGDAVTVSMSGGGIVIETEMDYGTAGYDKTFIGIEYIVNTQLP